MTGLTRSKLVRRVSTGAGLLAVSNVLSALLSFVLAALIGRSLGQTGLGSYSTALAWVFPFVLLAEFGLNTLITREAAQYPDQAQSILQRTHSVRLILGVSGMLLLWVLAPVLSNGADVVMGIRISSLFLLITPIFGAYTAILRAQGHMAMILALNVGMLASQVGLSLIAMAAGYGLQSLLVINVVTSGGQLIAAWLICRTRTASNRESETVPENEAIKRFSAKNVLKRAWPFALAGILAAVQGRVGLLLLERLASPVEVGNYAAASRFIEAGRVLPAAFSGALFPVLVAMSGDVPVLRVMFRRAMVAYGGYGGLAALLLMVLSVPILTLTYGLAFVSAAPVLALLGWTLLPSLVRSALTLYAYARGKESFTNQVTVVLLCVQLVGGLLLIPQNQAAGAATALLVAECSGCVLLMIGLRR